MNLKSTAAKVIAALLPLFLIMSYAAPVRAQLPTGGVLVRGDATWTDDGQTMTVTQGSERAVIDWLSFDVGAGNTVIFDQPGQGAVILNRITGDDPSHILGQLTANGSVFLVNPHGVIFGSDAVIDVGALIASSLWMDIADPRNQPFWDPESDLDLAWGETQGLAFSLRDGDPLGDVVNLGQIEAAGDDSYIFLLGPALVKNEGSLRASGDGRAQVGLAAGGEVRFRRVVDWDENVYRRFIVDKATAEALVSNGVSAAGSGQVDVTASGESVFLLGAAAVRELRQSVINQQGVVYAQRMEVVGGDSGTVVLGGTYSNASSWDMDLWVTGERIAVASDAGAEDVLFRVRDMELAATEEIVINSPLVYWNEGYGPYAYMTAPVVTVDAPVIPYASPGQTSRLLDLRLRNLSSETFTVASGADARVDVDSLVIQGINGSIDLAGPALVSETDLGVVVAFTDELSRLRMEHPDNRLVELRLSGHEGWNLDEALSVGEIYIRNGEADLIVAGNVSAKGDVFIWNQGGDVILSDLDHVALGAGGLITLAATHGGVFVNHAQAGADVFTGPGRVRIYSSSDGGRYDAGGLESWEYGAPGETVAFLADPAAPQNVIYFLDEQGAVVIVVRVQDASFVYGDLDDTALFDVRYYFKGDPTQELDASYVTGLRFQLSDAQGNWREIGAESWADFTVGSHWVRGFDGDGGPYRLEYVPGEITVTPRPLTITVGDAQRRYGMDNSALIGTPVSFDGLAAWDRRGWSDAIDPGAGDYILESADPLADVGQYAIDFVAQSERLQETLANYDVTYVPGKLQVTHRRLVLDVGTIQRWYGDANDFSAVSLAIGAGGDGIAPGQTLADLGIGAERLRSSATSTSVPGVYSLSLDTAGLGSPASNYEITVEGSLVVTKRPVVVKAHDLTIRYLDSLPAVGGAYSHSDLGDGIALTNWPLPELRLVKGPGSGADPLPAGQYAIEWYWPYVQDPQEHPYYRLTYEPGTLLVVPRPIEVEIHQHSRYYGTTSPNAAYEYTITGMPAVYDPRVAPKLTFETGPVTERSDAGMYKGVITGSSDDPNYTITWKNAGDLIILPAELVLRGGVLRKTYGDSLDWGEGAFRLDAARPWDNVPGLAPWDNPEDVVAGVQLFSGGADPAAAAGSYDLVVTGYRLINPNYTIKDVYDGVLYVDKRDLYVAVGDVEYRLNERKPYPIIRFENVAPHDSVDALLAQGCLEVLDQTSCRNAVWDGEGPYFVYDRTQGKAVHGGWGFVYNGPWHWTFLWNADALRNYNLIHGPTGREIILPPFSMEEMIDLVFVNPRERDRVFEPSERAPSPESRPAQPIVIDTSQQIELGPVQWDGIETTLISDGVTCVLPEGTPIHVDCDELLNPRGQRAAEMYYERFTAGFPVESQEILGRALAKWMDGPTGVTLSATNLEAYYERLKAGDDELFARIFPYLVAELHAILEKDEAELTRAERAYVDHLALVIQAERRRTAQLAKEALDDWQRRQEQRLADGPMLNTLFDYGGAVPDYVKNAVTQAQLGIGIQSGKSEEMTHRIVELMAATAGPILAGLGGGGVGATGALSSLVPFIFPFAQRGGEAIVLLSGVSAGASIFASAVMVSMIAGIALGDIIGQIKVENAVEEALRRAEEPPPTFADLKAMLETEEGQVHLLMHQMNALTKFVPGGELETYARTGITNLSDRGFWDFLEEQTF